MAAGSHWELQLQFLAPSSGWGELMDAQQEDLKEE